MKFRGAMKLLAAIWLAGAIGIFPETCALAAAGDGRETAAPTADAAPAQTLPRERRSPQVRSTPLPTEAASPDRQNELRLRQLQREYPAEYESERAPRR